MAAYIVTLNGKHIDTVFYNDCERVDDVKRSLVDHDGYNPAIVVTKARKRPKIAPKGTNKRIHEASPSVDPRAVGNKATVLVTSALEWPMAHPRRR